MAKSATRLKGARLLRERRLLRNMRGIRSVMRKPTLSDTRTVYTHTYIHTTSTVTREMMMTYFENKGKMLCRFSDTKMR